MVPKFIRMDGLSNIIFSSGDFTAASRPTDPQLYALHPFPFTLTTSSLAITDDSSSSITYSGSWYGSTWQGFGSDYFDSTQHFGNAVGDSATFSFTGSTIEWIGSTNNNHGYADVSIDGGAPTVVNGYSPDWTKQVTLFKRTDLSPGGHTIKITITGQHDPRSGGTYQDVDAFITAATS